MSAVIPEGRQKRVTSAQKVSSLEQHAAELSEQLKQLQLENHRLRRRERVLAAVSSATQQAVNMIQQLGSAIQGIAAPVSQPQSLSIAKIDACIGITLRDLECSTLGAAPMSSGPLRWPTDANTPLAQQLAGGGPLALMQHSLGLLQRYHQYLGWVQRQTPETSRDMLYLIQGVIHQLHNKGLPEEDHSHSSCAAASSSTQPTYADVSGKETKSSSKHSNVSSSGSAGTHTQQGCTGSGSSATSVPPCLAAAAARSVAAAAAAGGGRALGCTLAFLEVAGVVHDALLEQQQAQQGQAQGQGQGQEQHWQDECAANGKAHHRTNQQQLVEAWAEVLLAAAQHSCWAPQRGKASPEALPSAAAGADRAGCPDEGGGWLSHNDCALLGAVMGFLGALQVVYMNEPGRIMALGQHTMRPLPAAKVQAVTQSMCMSCEQLREVLWVSALYQDLRKPHNAAHTELEMLVVEVLVRMASQGPPPAAGAMPVPVAPAAAEPVPPERSAAEPAPATAAAAAAEGGRGARAEGVGIGKPPPAPAMACSSDIRSSSGQDAHREQPPRPPAVSSDSAGDDDDSDAQLLRQLLLRLQAQARLNIWWEVLQHSHGWGLLSLRQVSAFIIGMAPAGPSPNCWSTRLLRALLEGEQSPLAAMTAAAAGIPHTTAQQAAAGRTQQPVRQKPKSARLHLTSSEPGRVHPWEPLPPVDVPGHLLPLPGGTSCAAASAAAAPTTAPEASLGQPELSCPPGTTPAAATAYVVSTLLPPLPPSPPRQQQKPHLAGPSPLHQAAPARPTGHPGGWMAWLAGPSGPLGRDAPALMPLVAAAQMSAAGAPAAAAPAAATGGPAMQPSEHLPPLPFLHVGPCNAPHSPVPPDLFDGEECLTPASRAPLMDPACPQTKHPGGGVGEGPSSPSFDLLDVRPELALPDDALSLLQQLLVGLEEVPLNMPQWPLE